MHATTNVGNDVSHSSIPELPSLRTVLSQLQRGYEWSAHTEKWEHGPIAIWRAGDLKRNQQILMLPDCWDHEHWELKWVVLVQPFVSNTGTNGGVAPSSNCAPVPSLKLEPRPIVGREWKEAKFQHSSQMWFKISQGPNFKFLNLEIQTLESIPGYYTLFDLDTKIRHLHMISHPKNLKSYLSQNFLNRQL